MRNDNPISEAAEVGVDCLLGGANPPAFSALHFDPGAPSRNVQVRHTRNYAFSLQRGTSGGAARPAVGYRINQHAGEGFAEPNHDGHLFRVFEGI